jgi:hypothetical protein
MATQSNLEQREVLLRRILDPLSDVDSLPSRRRRTRSVAPHAEVRSFLIRSTHKVIDHYRSVLSVHQMSDIDNNAILVRLEEQERALRELMRQDEELSEPRIRILRLPSVSKLMGAADDIV